MEIIKDSYIEESVYYTLDYELKTDPGSGFSFPCDQNGKIERLNDSAQANYRFCQNNVNYNGPYIRKHIEHYRHGKTGKCNCGEVFELQNEYYGACQCPNCGQWYNLFGQHLTDPEYWEKSVDF